MSIVQEIREFISSDDNSIATKIYDPIGDINSTDQLTLKTFIRNAVDTQPSHTLTGLYSLGNMESRPYKFYMTIGKLATGGILLNVDPNRSWMIAIDYHARDEHYTLLKQILGKLTSVFFSTGGKRLIQMGNSLFDQQVFVKKLYNNVYRLEDFDPQLETHCNASADVIIHPSNQKSYTKIKKFYHYREDNHKNIANTHVVLELNDQLVAGARTNEELDKNVVIGGVRTEIEYRKQRLGFTVCYYLIKELQNTFSNIFLETDVDNFPAIRIYEQLGFSMIGRSAFYEKGLEMISEVIGDRNY